MDGPTLEELREVKGSPLCCRLIQESLHFLPRQGLGELIRKFSEHGGPYISRERRFRGDGSCSIDWRN